MTLITVAAMALAVPQTFELCQQRGPLIEHFQELGRRFAHVLDAPPKPGMRVI